MAELKTKATNASVADFLSGIADDARRADCATLVDLMQKAAKAPPKMWGPAIIGFGECRLKYESGRELDWFHIGFSPRKANFALYLMAPLESFADLLPKLGKHSTAKSCLYVKKLEDVDLAVLRKMIALGVKHSKTRKDPL